MFMLFTTVIYPFAIIVSKSLGLFQKVAFLLASKDYFKLLKLPTWLVDSLARMAHSHLHSANTSTPTAVLMVPHPWWLCREMSSQLVSTRQVASSLGKVIWEAVVVKTPGAVIVKQYNSSKISLPCSSSLQETTIMSFHENTWSSSSHTLLWSGRRTRFGDRKTGCKSLFCIYKL